jgi:hypothetical protein
MYITIKKKWHGFKDIKNNYVVMLVAYSKNLVSNACSKWLSIEKLNPGKLQNYFECYGLCNLSLLL